MQDRYGVKEKLYTMIAALSCYLNDTNVDDAFSPSNVFCEGI